jgi:prevent-host-death family protein
LSEKSKEIRFACRATGLLAMKVVPLSEAKSKLSRYGQQCHHEPVIVTVNGKPSFQLVPLKKEDDLVDRLIEDDPAFGKLLQRRLRERAVSVETASRRLSAMNTKAQTSPRLTSRIT